MAKIFEELDATRGELQEQLACMIEDHSDDADFWCAFAGDVDVIEDSAGQHCAHERSRINCMHTKSPRLQ